MFSLPKRLDDAGQTHRKKDVCLLLWHLELCGHPRAQCRSCHLSPALRKDTWFLASSPPILPQSPPQILLLSISPTVIRSPKRSWRVISGSPHAGLFQRINRVSQHLLSHLTRRLEFSSYTIKHPQSVQRLNELGDVQTLAGHAGPRTTRLYDRSERKVTQNLVEWMKIGR